MGSQPLSWTAVVCAGIRCYSAVNCSNKAVDYTANSPHLVLGTDFRVKTKAFTPCGSPGPGLAWQDFLCTDGTSDGASLELATANQC